MIARRPKTPEKVLAYMRQSRQRQVQRAVAAGRCIVCVTRAVRPGINPKTQRAYATCRKCVRDAAQRRRDAGYLSPQQLTALTRLAGGARIAFTGRKWIYVALVNAQWTVRGKTVQSLVKLRYANIASVGTIKYCRITAAGIAAAAAANQRAGA